MKRIKAKAKVSSRVVAKSLRRAKAFGKMSKYAQRRFQLAAFLLGPIAASERATGARRLQQDCYYDTPNGDASALNVAACNTSACALGWATKVFPEDLYLEVGNVYSHKNPLLGIRLGQEFFGVSERTADRLFGFEAATPKQKAAELLAVKDGE